MKSPLFVTLLLLVTFATSGCSTVQRGAYRVGNTVSSAGRSTGNFFSNLFGGGSSRRSASSRSSSSSSSSTSRSSSTGGSSTSRSAPSLESTPQEYVGN
ncbi:MAG: hypothetical protein WA771_01140 [Chthoniobacterales bacterium]